MGKSDQQWDKLLKIQTVRTDDADADDYRYAYEPTPYPVFERLAESGYLERDNTLLDYGCGKGRAVFCLSYLTRCRAIGLEYNERILKAARENQLTALSGKRVEFVQADAQEFRVPSEVDRCFFFNPFSVEIFRKAYARILDSWYENPRQIVLFFYFLADEYLDYIQGSTDLRFCEEIDCTAWPIGDPKRENVKIFALDPLEL